MAKNIKMAQNPSRVDFKILSASASTTRDNSKNKMLATASTWSGMIKDTSDNKLKRDRTSNTFT